MENITIASLVGLVVFVLYISACKMRDLANIKAKELMLNFAKKNGEAVKVLPGDCRWNYKCQVNAVHNALRAGETSICMGIYLDYDYPIIHFWNESLKEDIPVYTDNSLGEWAVTYTYYLIRHIKADEFWSVNEIFGAFREEINSTFPLWVRVFKSFQV